MSVPVTAAALNEQLAQSLGRGRALSRGDRARIAAAFHATLKPGQGPLVIFPTVQGLDWDAIKRDQQQPLVIVNNPVRAYELCVQGQPTIAILGASRGWVRKWIQNRGGTVKDQRELN